MYIGHCRMKECLIFTMTGTQNDDTSSVKSATSTATVYMVAYVPPQHAS